MNNNNNNNKSKSRDKDEGVLIAVCIIFALLELKFLSIETLLFAVGAFLLLGWFLKTPDNKSKAKPKPKD